MSADKIQSNTILGKWTEEKIDTLLRQSWSIDEISARIDFLSARFTYSKYSDGTLIGDAATPEVFVINLKEIDCFTYLDYVEAMTLSRSFAEFRENLRNIRYRSGVLTFENRNHFFTDWREVNADIVEDVTAYIAGDTSIEIEKTLNVKEDGTNFLNGIQPVKRQLSYIPSRMLNDELMEKLKTGDFIGIYSEIQGLDVSHVGIITIEDNIRYLRHASSAKEYRKVIDQDLKDYLLNKPGIIVLRPKE
jgi:hypothetical protein